MTCCKKKVARCVIKCKICNVNTTHITTTLRAIIARSGKTDRWLAQVTGVSAPTLGRLDKHRVSPETLQALCTKIPNPAEGLELLIAHLRDEIDRAGRLQSEVTIEAVGEASSDDVALFLHEAQTNEHLRGIITDFAAAIRRKHAWEQAQRTEALSYVVEDQAPYGVKAVAEAKAKGQHQSQGTPPPLKK